MAQWLRPLDYLTTRTSLSPIRHGFMPGFVNYKKGCIRLAAASDKVYQLLAHGWWFSQGTPASSTSKTGRHDIAEILLKVALKIKSINQNTFWLPWIVLILICLRVQYGSILWLEDGNLYLRLRTMSHTNYAAKFEQTIIHQHVHLRRESQSHAAAHVLMRLYPIDKSFVYKVKEGRHVRIIIIPLLHFQ